MSMQGICRKLLSCCVIYFSTTSAYGAPSVADYQAVPPLLAESASPMIMLAMSNDHQLFYKSFTDYDDIDGDGTLDTTYKNTIEYAGYFDSQKCYRYNGSMFIPARLTDNNYCNYFANDEWSGNFLNWATMTRVDQVRKVLYGGKRSLDSPSETVLERSYLPSDAHSFAKYYNGEDLRRLTPFGQLTTGVENSRDSGVTFCNTTYAAGKVLSQNVTAPPLVRAVKGNYSLWAANERYQCLYEDEADKRNGNDPALSGIYAYSSNPQKTARAPQANGSVYADYIVRIKACVSESLIGNEDCRQYPQGNYKPIGLLQTFGEDKATLWGLMTGSYRKNKSGGVLRKNIGSINNEINIDTNGTFITQPEGGGIIQTIDRLRIVNYAHDPGYYNDADKCQWGIGAFAPGTNSFPEGNCSNWGNPFAELMLECYRYFAGAKPTADFAADDSGLIAGLNSQTSWKNPQDDSTACAQLNLIAFNTGTVSYDGDSLGGVKDLHTSQSAESLTNTVGDGEGINGNYYFVGKNGGNNNQLCTAKKIEGLGEADGICPTSPRLEGSYKAAGIAYHARTEDLRPDITDEQTVNTYGVALAPAIPNVVMQAPGTGRKITLLPACRNSDVGGNCGLVDFKVVSQVVGASTVTGSFYVSWEDSEQGADYDQDMNGILEYELTANQLKIKTDVFASSTSQALGFGFIVSGTTEDGFHALSGVKEFSGYGCTQCKAGDSAAFKTFTLGVSSIDGSRVSLLESPLFYASKWGGFEDVDGNNKPDLEREWDRKNNRTGVYGADGLPDNYFFAVNPKELKTQLTHILIDILERTASGTAAAVISNTGAGDGAIYQALYNPRVTDEAGKTSVTWVGALNALFLDRFGNLREDNSAPFGQLNTSDWAVKIFYDNGARRTRLQRYTVNSDGSLGGALAEPAEINEIRSIWSAQNELAQVADYSVQRSQYSEPAAKGRYILTGIDENGDGLIASAIQKNLVNSEVKPFTADTFIDNQSNNYRLLGITTFDEVKAKYEASQLVDFTRGVEGLQGFRSRTLLTATGSFPWLLGDIVHSSPAVVGRPKESFDVSFNDDTYRQFKRKYQDRRQMVYVGANDGMLHAFNGGFYDAQNARYKLSHQGETEHSLGAELWAYVPFNVLPHLQWLALPDYPHVYTVDGPVKTFDVNIFPDDDVHPGGWGTVLVATLRFGGGDYTLDPNSAPDGDTSDDITLRSSVVVIDVTDPERPPNVLLEYTDERLGYTTAEPTVVKFREVSAGGSFSNPDINQWFLLLGSGPYGGNGFEKSQALNEAVSFQTARVTSINLKNHSVQHFSTPTNRGFIGGIQSTSWGRSGSDSAIYLGTVSGDPVVAGGQLLRGQLSHSAGSLSISFNDLVYPVSRPVSATPFVQRDVRGDTWVYAGTGRFFVVNDNFSVQQQSYYGVREPSNGLATTVLKTELVNTTGIESFTDGTVLRNGQAPLLNTGDAAENFPALLSAVAGAQGWYFDFRRRAGRNTTQATSSDVSLVFTEYQPSGLKCEPEGLGFIHAPHLFAGVAGSFAPLGTDESVTSGEASLVLDSVSLGYGSPSTPHIHLRADGARAAVVQTSTGEITQQRIQSSPGQGARQSWREVPITW